MATLNIRGDDLSLQTIVAVKRSARLRGWTIGRYLTQLVALHDEVRARADAGDDGLQAELQALGLATYREAPAE